MRISALIFLTIIISSLHISGQWERIYIDEVDTFDMFCLADISFINKNKGIIAAVTQEGSGFHELISTGFMTQDGGKKWKTVEFPVSNLRRCILLDSSTILIAAGNQLFRSVDEGNSWQQTAELDEWVYDIHFTTDSIGFAITSENSIIHRTINKGKSWQKYKDLPCCFHSIFFQNEYNGIAVGSWGWIISMTDSPVWDARSSGTYLPLKKVFFINKETGWIAGGFEGDGFHSIFLKTIDGGENWDSIPGVDYLISDFLFMNSKVGWAIGNDQFGKGVILESIDGGQYWDIICDTFSLYSLRALHFKNGVGWIGGGNFGNYGQIFKNENSGYTLDVEPFIASKKDDILLKNYPNPFREKTVISYQLPIISEVEINIYDFTGRKVTTLINERLQGGSHEVEWNATGFTPGIYFCELRTPNNRRIQKMILLQ